MPNNSSWKENTIVIHVYAAVYNIYITFAFSGCVNSGVCGQQLLWQTITAVEWVALLIRNAKNCSFLLNFGKEHRSVRSGIIGSVSISSAYVQIIKEPEVNKLICSYVQSAAPEYYPGLPPLFLHDRSVLLQCCCGLFIQLTHATLGLQSTAAPLLHAQSITRQIHNLWWGIKNGWSGHADTFSVDFCMLLLPTVQCFGIFRWRLMWK